MNWNHLAYVALGGAAGSSLRYALGLYIARHWQGHFPLGTFAANILGSLVIGFLLGLTLKAEGLSPSLKVLLMTGFCGGFTTFSSFAMENLNLLKSGHHGTALLYMGATYAAGLLAVWLGLLVAKP